MSKTDPTAIIAAQAESEIAALAAYEPGAQALVKDAEVLQTQLAALEPQIKALREQINAILDPVRSEQDRIAERFDALLAEAEAIDPQTAKGERALNELKAMKPTQVLSARGPRQAQSGLQKDRLMEQVRAIAERGQSNSQAGDKS